MKLKVAYIHGRPAGHPTHAHYAKSIQSHFFFEDEILRWQDLDASKIRRYSSWILNALFFKKKRSWDVFLTDSFRPPQYFLKKLRILRKDQKLFSLMADETLYFCREKKYPSLTQKMMVDFWKTCDGIICIGEFQTEILKSLIPEHHHFKIRTIYNGVPQKRFSSLKLIEPNLSSFNITFIGNITTYWRASYKGLDLMIKAFAKSLKKHPELNFYIVGEYSNEVKVSLLENIADEASKKIHFLGKLADFETQLKNTSLYLHCAKGEAWGISINEAIRAGIPTIVSTETGAKEAVSQISKSLIVQAEVEKISEAINQYYDLPLSDRVKLSEKGRQVSEYYSENEAIKNFHNTFLELYNYLR